MKEETYNAFNNPMRKLYDLKINLPRFLDEFQMKGVLITKENWEQYRDAIPQEDIDEGCQSGYFDRLFHITTKSPIILLGKTWHSIESLYYPDGDSGWEVNLIAASKKGRWCNTVRPELISDTWVNKTIHADQFYLNELRVKGINLRQELGVQKPELMEDLVKWNPQMLKQVPTENGNWWGTQADIIIDLLSKLNKDKAVKHELAKVSLIDRHGDDYYIMVIELYADNIFPYTDEEPIYREAIHTWANSLGLLTGHSIAEDEDLTIITCIFTF